MSFITLTTDFGTKDHYVGAVKGAIYSGLPEAKIVDISHEISPFNITETAYVLKNAYQNFPKGTIHIVGVDSELSVENKHLAIYLDEHYFICPDNGLISMIAAEVNPEKIVELSIHDNIETSFTVLNVFVQAACFIARGGKLEVIGKELSSYKKLSELQPKVNSENTIISGHVIYIDNYGNVITNISKKIFKDVGKGRDFTIFARRYTFTKIHTRYTEIVDFNAAHLSDFEGAKLAIFNSSDFLEIAIYKSNLDTVGGASSLLGLQYRDTISVEFSS